MMKKIMQFSLISAAVCLAACGGGGDNNSSNAAADTRTPSPTTTASISGHIQKPEGGHEPVSTTSLDAVTYKGVAVSLREEDALMDMEDRPANRGGMDVEGDYLGVKVGNGYGALRVYDDLSYARFGDISSYDMTTHQISDTVGFFQGIATAEMPKTGSAVYTGTAYQFGKTAAGAAIADYNGNMTAQADFAGGKVHIALRNVTVPVDATASIRGNTFIEHSVVPGRGLVGGFFGANAAEVAGIVQQTNNGEWTATFGGKR